MVNKYLFKKKLWKVVCLPIFSGIIISATQISVHFSRISVIPSMGVFSLFFAPLICSIVTTYLMEIENMRLGVYWSFGIFGISTLLMIIVFWSPFIMHVAEPLAPFTLWMMKKLFLSSIFMFPAILVGCVLGVAISG